MQNIPDGCFTVGSVALRHFTVLMDILNGLDVAALPEQSIAQHFARYAKEVLHISNEHRSRYTHVLANGRVVHAWAYDLRYLTTFEKWLWGLYFPQHFPAYERYRARRVGLPAPKPRQPLLAQTQRAQIIQQSFAWE